MSNEEHQDSEREDHCKAQLSLLLRHPPFNSSLHCCAFENKRIFP